MDRRICACGKEIPPPRLEILPNTRTCVRCSTEQPKAGRVVTYGSGEEIYTELEVLERDIWRKVHEVEKIRSTSFARLKEEDEERDSYVRYQNSFPKTTEE